MLHCDKRPQINQLIWAVSQEAPIGHNGPVGVIYHFPHRGVPIVLCHYLWKNVTGLNIKENACWIQTKILYLISIWKIFLVRYVLGILLDMKNMRKTLEVLIKSVIFCKQ